MRNLSRMLPNQYYSLQPRPASGWNIKFYRLLSTIAAEVQQKLRPPGEPRKKQLVLKLQSKFLHKMPNTFVLHVEKCTWRKLSRKKHGLAVISVMLGITLTAHVKNLKLFRNLIIYVSNVVIAS